MTRTEIRAALATLAIIVVINGAVAWAVFRWPWATDAAGAALLLYLALEWPSISRGGRKMATAALAAALAALVLLPQAVPVLRHGLAEAAFIVGLFTTLGMLRDSAQSSRLIRRCGEQMVRQRPGRRYAALSLGSHLISLVLNFGVLALLGVMVAKGNTLSAANGDEIVKGIRKRRMMTAVMRGFAMMTVWSPLAVSFTVIEQAVPGLVWWRLLPLQVTLSLILMGWGWALDRMDFPPHTRRLPHHPHRTDFRPILSLTALVAAIVAGAVAMAEVLDARLVVGAMIVVPPSAAIWLYRQQSGPPRPRAALTARLFLRRLGVSLPNFRSEVAMLGGAMFLGVVVAAFVAPEDMARAIALIPLPPIALAVLIAWGVMAAAHAGISQLVTVTLAGSALGSLAQAGISPQVMASGLLGAWALSICTTPVGAAVMSVARVAEVPVKVVSRTWNRRFVLVGALLLAVWMVILSLVL
ncbi:hypothetical protein H261_04977 [Paramagnetospirillum caucaseum]|uniref:Uncharacterized protein n=1 Tax=Paramagnetospirillum caucaseum TaxID=1244869 RepID=M2ZUP2_9PROT|nr:hypothetical protein [Paramagnetospirillum caucaseum]EME71087.1 hypothetical protein H261_04977 [Paramagnetospirillum caucaseum]